MVNMHEEDSLVLNISVGEHDIDVNIDGKDEVDVNINDEDDDIGFNVNKDDDIGS